MGSGAGRGPRMIRCKEGQRNTKPRIRVREGTDTPLPHREEEQDGSPSELGSGRSTEPLRKGAVLALFTVSIP